MCVFNKNRCISSSQLDLKIEVGEGDKYSPPPKEKASTNLKNI